MTIELKNPVLPRKYFKTKTKTKTKTMEKFGEILLRVCRMRFYPRESRNLRQKRKTKTPIERCTRDRTHSVLLFYLVMCVCLVKLVCPTALVVFVVVIVCFQGTNTHADT